jgi:hypothetical protein
MGPRLPIQPYPRREERAMAMLRKLVREPGLLTEDGRLVVAPVLDSLEALDG